MKRPVSDRARQLATELQRLFAQDTELAHKLNDAHRRLLDANNRPWSGLHPDGLRAVYGDHLASEAMQLATAGSGRSRVLDSSDALGAVQESHWEIHRAYCEYQEVAEARRRLAVDVGETIRAFLDELVTAGWSEQAAPQRERPRTRWIGGIAAMIDPVNELIDEILARGPGRSERFELRPDRPRAGDPAFAEASALHQTEGAGSRLVNEARLSSGSIDPCDAGRAS